MLRQIDVLKVLACVSVMALASAPAFAADAQSPANPNCSPGTVGCPVSARSNEAADAAFANENTSSAPGAAFTDPQGINDSGEIVGIFENANGVYAFEASPATAMAAPEPSSFVMAGTAILMGLGYAWRRHRKAKPAADDVHGLARAAQRARNVVELVRRAAGARATPRPVLRTARPDRAHPGRARLYQDTHDQDMHAGRKRRPARPLPPP